MIHIVFLFLIPRLVFVRGVVSVLLALRLESWLSTALISARIVLNGIAGIGGIMAVIRSLLIVVV